MSEITPEKVAATVSRFVDSGWRHRLQAALSVTAEGNVLNLSVTRWEDDEQGTEVVRHFRAVVVEGETVPDLAEIHRLKGRLEAAEAIMRNCLYAVEHGEVLYLLGLYFAAAEAAQAEQERQS